MKRKPRELILNVRGVDEYFLLSTKVFNEFSLEQGSNDPDEANKAYAKDPWGTLVTLTRIAYNEHPRNRKKQISKDEAQWIIDDLVCEDVEGGDGLTKWGLLQERMVHHCFPRTHRVKNPNGEAVKSTSP
jgi:hypothetical protein